MSSSVMEYAASNNSNNCHQDENEQFDFLRTGGDLTCREPSLPAETFLKTAISLKDQVNFPY